MTLSKTPAYTPETNPIPIIFAANAITASTMPRPAGVKLINTDKVDKTAINEISKNGMLKENALNATNNLIAIINNILISKTINFNKNL